MRSQASSRRHVDVAVECSSGTTYGPSRAMRARGLGSALTSPRCGARPATSRLKRAHPDELAAA